ncbi:MAG: aspartate aminotransferase family protein [Bacillota bacterium]
MGQILEDDNKFLLNVYNRLGLEIVDSEGSYLIDSDGKHYLDMFSGIAVNSLGYSDTGLKAEIKDQLDKYIHLSNYFASKPVTELARLLVENTQAAGVFFANSGSEANEAAFKLARLYAKSINKDKIEFLAAKDGFHGRTAGSLSLTGREKYRDKFAPLLPHIKHFDFNNSKDLRDKVSDNTAAVFLEIIQGEGGVHEISREFITTVKKLSQKYNFLVIVDEIQTGMGRTGKFLASDYYDFEPDLLTLAKSLGGGLPLGALLVSEKLKDVFSPGDHGSTFGGNPVACAAGAYMVETIADDNFLARLQKKSSFLITELMRLKTDYPRIIKDIRGRGLMLGVECGLRAVDIKKRALKENLLLNVTDNTVIRLLPPLNIKKKELEKFIEIMEKLIAGVARE